MSVRRVVVALVAAAIAVAGVAAVVWARSYQPLGFAGGASGVESEGVARRYDAENDEGEPVRGFELVLGASLVRNGFDLDNQGRLAVEVEGVPSESGPLAVVGLSAGRARPTGPGSGSSRSGRLRSKPTSSRGS